MTKGGIHLYIFSNFKWVGSRGCLGEPLARMEVVSGPCGVSSPGDAGSTERYVKVPYYSLI